MAELAATLDRATRIGPELCRISLTEKRKKILLESDPHPLGRQEVELDWLVPTDLRRRIFVEHRSFEEIQGDGWFFRLVGYDTFFSENLLPEVKVAAEELFDSMHFGCVW